MPSRRLGPLDGRWVCSQPGTSPHCPLFRTRLPDPPSSPAPFLPRWPPHRGGGHPGAGHREPHHLRRDRPALGRLRLRGQQARHPGEKNSAGPAGGARYLPPHPWARGHGAPTQSRSSPAPGQAAGAALPSPSGMPVPATGELWPWPPRGWAPAGSPAASAPSPGTPTL